MNVEIRPGAIAASQTRLAIADCNLHPTPGKASDIWPYLSKRWREHAQTYGLLPRHGYQAGPAYPKGQPDAARLDSWPPDGKPGSQVKD